MPIPQPGSPSAAVPHHPTQNRLLAALPDSEYQRLLPHLELVPMPLGEVLYESGGRLQHVYFPTTSIVSLLYVLENGASAEIAVVGNEGILGISLFMGGETTPSRAIVQSAGDRLPTDEVSMTQELIANMLGVRREGVTDAAGKLQRAGLIRYSRGRIEVLDRPGLEKAVCECYQVVKLEFDRLLSDVPRGDPFRVVKQSIV